MPQVWPSQGMPTRSPDAQARDAWPDRIDPADDLVAGDDRQTSGRATRRRRRAGRCGRRRRPRTFTRISPGPGCRSGSSVHSRGVRGLLSTIAFIVFSLKIMLDSIPGGAAAGQAAERWEDPQQQGQGRIRSLLRRAARQPPLRPRTASSPRRARRRQCGPGPSPAPPIASSGEAFALMIVRPSGAAMTVSGPLSNTTALHSLAAAPARFSLSPSK